MQIYNSTLNCKDFLLDSSVCAGHGSCEIATGICICKDYWSSNGDYAFYGETCDLNNTSIRGLWIANLSIWVIFYLILIRFFAYKLFILKRKVKITETVMIFATLILFSETSSVAMIILKLLNPEQNLVGKSYIITALNSMMVAFMFSGACAHWHLIIIFFSGCLRLMKQERQEHMRLKFKFMRNMSWILGIFPYLVSIILTVGVGYQKYLTIFGGLHYVAFAFQGSVHTYFIAYEGLYCMAKELKQVADSIDIEMATAEDMAILKLRKLMSKGCVVFTFFAASTCLVALIIGFWPELIRKSSYLTPIIDMTSKFCKLICVASVSVFKEAVSAPSSQTKRSVNGTSQTPHADRTQSKHAARAKKILDDDVEEIDDPPKDVSPVHIMINKSFRTVSKIKILQKSAANAKSERKIHISEGDDDVSLID